MHNGLYRSTGSDTSHINQIGILQSWAHGTSDSHQIWYLGLYTNSGWLYQKLSWWIHRVQYLPYKSNRFTGILSTWNVRFTPKTAFNYLDSQVLGHRNFADRRTDRRTLAKSFCFCFLIKYIFMVYTCPYLSRWFIIFHPLMTKVSTYTLFSSGNGCKNKK